MHVPRRALVITGAAALLVGVGTAAGATINAGPVNNGVITGCYVTKTTNGSHALVLEDPDASCPKGDTAVEWNQKGTAGPKGATGPRGPQGATGPQGIQGPTGSAGIGATVNSLFPGNANCTDGGASITDGSGNTAYACNGAQGPAGAGDAISNSLTVNNPSTQQEFLSTPSGDYLEGDCTSEGVSVELYPYSGTARIIWTEENGQSVQVGEGDTILIYASEGPYQAMAVTQEVTGTQITSYTVTAYTNSTGTCTFNGQAVTTSLTSPDQAKHNR
jgi:hypothetical protein